MARTTGLISARRRSTQFRSQAFSTAARRPTMLDPGAVLGGSRTTRPMRSELFSRHSVSEAAAIVEIRSDPLQPVRQCGTKSLSHKDTAMRPGGWQT